METSSAPTAARKLNMDEKRKLEKLLLSDVDTAAAAYRAQRSAKQELVKDAAITNAPRQARGLLAAYLATRSNANALLERIHKMGYSVPTYGDNEDKLDLHYNTKPKPVRDFDAETARVEKSLADLKRSYTLKLFAGGEEAKELFASLARELANIVNQKS
jgi:uncharacterized protein (UPF0128 family)